MSSAEVLLGGTSTTPVEPEEVDEEVDAVEEDTTEEDPQETDTEEEETEELPDAVKDILRKNRKSLREAEARAAAAEKALANKDADPDAPPSETSDRFKDLYLTSAAKSALVDAGITTGTEKFLRMIDLTAIEISDDGKLSGLDEQIAEIKDDFKDILAPKKKAPAKVDGAGRRVTPPVKKSSAQIMAERFNNG